MIPEKELKMLVFENKFEYQRDKIRILQQKKIKILK